MAGGTFCPQILYELLHKWGVPECPHHLIRFRSGNVTICNGSWFVCPLEMWLCKIIYDDVWLKLMFCMLLYDILLRKPNVKLHLIRSLLYRRIFEFCFLLWSPNSFLYADLPLNLPCARKNERKMQTRTGARKCAPNGARRESRDFPPNFLIRRKQKNRDFSHFAPTSCVSSPATSHVLYSSSSWNPGYFYFDRSCRFRCFMIDLSCTLLILMISCYKLSFLPLDPAKM